MSEELKFNPLKNKTFQLCRSLNAQFSRPPSQEENTELGIVVVSGRQGKDDTRSGSSQEARGSMDQTDFLLKGSISIAG